MLPPLGCGGLTPIRSCAAFSFLLEEEDLAADNWVVLEHAHGQRRPGAREGVEEAGRGHGDEAHDDDTGLGFFGHA